MKIVVNTKNKEDRARLRILISEYLKRLGITNTNVTVDWRGKTQ